jgi:hypothetical protein
LPWFGGPTPDPVSIRRLRCGYGSSDFINGTNGRFYEPGLERNVFFGLTVRAE